MEKISKHDFYVQEVQKLTLKEALTLTGYLFQGHYDVFGLILKGLAIDINSLNN